uniref:Hyphal wall protein 1 n=1 Tax=Parastrongyloides trichosuri TaxID=131310 RepID=A0A0N4ZJ19_PARTI
MVVVYRIFLSLFTISTLIFNTESYFVDRGTTECYCPCLTTEEPSSTLSSEIVPKTTDDTYSSEIFTSRPTRAKAYPSTTPEHDGTTTEEQKDSTTTIYEPSTISEEHKDLTTTLYESSTITEDPVSNDKTTEEHKVPTTTIYESSTVTEDSSNNYTTTILSESTSIPEPIIRNVSIPKTHLPNINHTTKCPPTNPEENGIIIKICVFITTIKHVIISKMFA